ncbi:MAG: YqiA/YcfP family alpha/beta fold hydrolase [Thermodesulfobacteriota bacterium]
MTRPQAAPETSKRQAAAQILLIHGLNGSGDHSTTGRTLKKAFGARVHTPNLPTNPAHWYDFLQGYLAENFRASEALILVGNSTGGLLAACLAQERGFPLVLINPVVEARDLSQFIGPNQKFASGEEWFFSKEDVESLGQYEVGRPTMPALLFLGQNDEILDHSKAAALYSHHDAKVVSNDNSHQYRLSDSDLAILKIFCGRDHR